MSTFRSTRTAFSWTSLPRPSTTATASHSINALVGTGKRSRDPVDDEQEEASNSTGTTSTKQSRGPDNVVVNFDRPFPCAFLSRRCVFRATCSYHHGVAESCDCDDIDCPKGHPHRRSPRACDHGLPHQCRWNTVGECSYHHGEASPCDCDDRTCPKAHFKRTVRQTKLRQEQHQTDPYCIERNRRKLFVGFSRKSIKGKPIRPKDLQTTIRDAIAVATNQHPLTMKTVATTAAASTKQEEEDPILEVQVLQQPSDQQQYAFVLFRSAAMATACLALEGLHFPGKGRIRMERPQDYQASPTTTTATTTGIISDDQLLHSFDTSKLDIVTKASKKHKKRQKKKQQQQTPSIVTSST